MFRVGIFLDFVWLTTRTPHGAYVRRARRNRIDRHGGEIERLALQGNCAAACRAIHAPLAGEAQCTASSKNFLLNQVYWEPGGGCIPEWLLDRVLPLDHQRHPHPAPPYICLEDGRSVWATRVPGRRAHGRGPCSVRTDRQGPSKTQGKPRCGDLAAAAVDAAVVVGRGSDRGGDNVVCCGVAGACTSAGAAFH